MRSKRLYLYNISTGSGDIPSALYAGVLAGKMDSNGNIAWIKTYGGEQGMGICQTEDGGYAIGAFTGSTGVPYGLVSGYKGGGDIWLLKIDSMGNFLWGNCYGSINAQEYTYSFSQTKDKGFILVGGTNGAGEDVPFHYGGMFSLDWFVVKTDSMGNKEWSKDLGGTGDESFCSIVTADSGYYLVGQSTSKDNDCADIGWHTGVNTYDDYNILRLDDTGKVIWSRSFGGSSDEPIYFSGSSAVWDERDKTIVVTGGSYSSDYMVTGSHGGCDIWTIKVDKRGGLVWEKSFGTANDDLGTAISIVEGVGYVNSGVVTGTIGGSDAWIGIIDMAGNLVSDTIFGGVKNDDAIYSFPYRQGYISIGTSQSQYGFTDGVNRGTLGWGNRGTVSYLAYGVNGIKNTLNPVTQLSAYPNPSDGVVTFSYNVPDAGVNLTITISDILGAKVKVLQTVNKTGSLNWNTRGLAAGVYLYQATNDKGMVSKGKLVVMEGR